MALCRVSLLLLVLAVSQSDAKMDGTFKCESPATCQSLVGYVPTNSTTLGALQTLFGVKNLRSILGVNNLPSSTSRRYLVPANQSIRIPVPCMCTNGTGVSNHVPMYTIRDDDTMYLIATVVYGGLVEYERIGEVNGIKNDNIIITGRKLWIPLPCSCDDVDGQDVMHYAHVVKSGSSVKEVAADFGTDDATLLKLNGISGDNEFIADKPFDVPLRACDTSVTKDSPDYPLRVTNGSYIFTAHNCVKCSCDAASNWTLHCEQSQDSPLKASNWSKCPSTHCEGASENLFIGNTTTTGSCSRSCAYSGFSNETISTTLLSEPTCAASKNKAASVRWGCNFLFLSILLALSNLFLYY